MPNSRKPEREVPRRLSLVTFDFTSMSKTFHRKYPLIAERPYVFLGEIPNMPFHCVVADHLTGQIHSGYHTSNFVEITSEEQ